MRTSLYIAFYRGWLNVTLPRSRKTRAENSAKDQLGRLKLSRKKQLSVNTISTTVLAHVAVRLDAWKRKEKR